MENKKLLILGGTQISLQILKAAKEMGLDVYVTDYYEDSPCKKFADKSFMVSATDVSRVVKLIEDENIDGVLMGYADVLMPYYNEICLKAGLPCYSNMEAIDVTTDKARFKQYCKKFNIPTVAEYSLADVKNGNAQYPLIVKPVDNSGARGIYICHNISEFEKNFEKALSYSKSKNVIIERLMTSGEATIFYYLHSGEVYLLGVADRWMHEQDKSVLKLPVGYTFPARNIEKFLRDQDKDIKNMFKSLNMKEGMVFMQSFVEDGKYIIYEMGYRLTGSIEHHLMDAAYGFNHLKKIISFAVGNEVDTQNLSKLNPSKCCMANITFLLKEGTIAKIKGLEQLAAEPYVASWHISHNEGDSITSENIGRLSQVGLRVLILADNYSQLLSRMDEIKDLVEIADESGNDMIIRNYSYTELCK